MRVHPISRALMSLKGKKTFGHKPLPSKEVALEKLRLFTGQDFGFDAKKWGEWLRAHRHVYYGAPKAVRSTNGSTAKSSVQYRYLAPNPKSFYRQLFVKGTRIRARAIYGYYANEEEPMTPAVIAREFGLPLEAVHEAIAYCESNPPELLEDYRREEAAMEATGMNSPEYRRHGKPRLLSAREMARLCQ